jgi:aryl-alcohol dehydrogenase-like predicted oxidoreductase
MRRSISDVAMKPQERKPQCGLGRANNEFERPLYRELGGTGISLFPVGLGAMPLSMQGRPNEAHALAVIDAALDAGMNFIDTANVYCASDDDIGHNERLIQKALRMRGATKAVVVATKGGVDRRQRRVDASPKFIRDSCIESLRALERETITLYQLHSPDQNVPFEDSVGELSQLQQEGKVVHVGLCNVTVAQLRRAQKIVRIESVQNACSPFNAAEYNDGMLEACEQQDLSFLPHSVIGGKATCASVVQHPLLVDLGRKYGASPYGIVVAWHLAKSPRIIPIPGASRAESAVSSALAARLELSSTDVRRIDRAE